MIRLTARSVAATAGRGEGQSDPILRARRARRDRGQRGMVTIELAMGSLAAVGLLIMMSWVVFVVVQQVRCIDLAQEVARQTARGDQQAVQRAKKNGPPGAQVSTDGRADTVRVEVRVRAEPFGELPMDFTVRAVAVAVWEPGEEAG